MRYAGFRAFKSPPVLNAYGWLRAFKSPYINACRVSSNTHVFFLFFLLISENTRFLERFPLCLYFNHIILIRYPSFRDSKVTFSLWCLPSQFRDLHGFCSQIIEYKSEGFQERFSELVNVFTAFVPRNDASFPLTIAFVLRSFCPLSWQYCTSLRTMKTWGSFNIK